MEFCCFRGGRFRRPLECVTPPPPVTGYSNPKCYLNHTADCCALITGEHYISEALLKEIGSTIRIPVPWLPKGETHLFPVKRMVANILCERHNISLSPLDRQGRDFFAFNRRACEHATTPGLPADIVDFLVNGNAVELAAVKILIGTYHAKMLTDRKAPMIRSHTLDARLFAAALKSGRLPEPCGMYVVPWSGEIIGEFSITPLEIPEEKRVIGIRFAMGAAMFDCIVDPSVKNLPGRRFYRPTELHINGPDRSAVVHLAWASRAIGGAGTVDIELGRYTPAR